MINIIFIRWAVILTLWNIRLFPRFEMKFGFHTLIIFQGSPTYQFEILVLSNFLFWGLTESILISLLVICGFLFLCRLTYIYLFRTEIWIWTWFVLILVLCISLSFLVLLILCFNWVLEAFLSIHFLAKWSAYFESNETPLGQDSQRRLYPFLFLVLPLKH